MSIGPHNGTRENNAGVSSPDFGNCTHEYTVTNPTKHIATYHDI